VSGGYAPARSRGGYDRAMCPRLDGDALPPGFRIVTPPTAFDRRVERMVRRIPAGTVASYGRVAEWVGKPEAPRAVGRVMANCDAALPWHRVVNSVGRLVPGHEAEHAERLRAEGVRVANGRVADPIPWWPGPRRRRGAEAGPAPSRSAHMNHR
jgi:methylated-DNA-protein-cysteine methyltransferase related protein